MSFAIFDDKYYLANNPDIQAAVEQGVLKSGLEHFQKYGLAEGRTSISPFYDEVSYLQTNPDVAAAVQVETFKSGLEHFIQYGEAEGRSGGSLLFDEQLYLQSNPDVAAAVETGTLKSGFQHYVMYGKAEGRSGINSFNEDVYLELNPDVAEAVQTGTFQSGIQHYVEYGQYEDRLELFSGTSGNDTVTGFGKGSAIAGADITRVSTGSVRSENLGRNEIDVLTGGPGTDLFIVGVVSSFPGIPTGIPRSFYEGSGDADYARITNFERGKDTIQLAGFQSFFYRSEVVDGNLNISTMNGDLIAVVEGVTSPLSPVSGTTSSGTIQVG